MPIQGPNPRGSSKPILASGTRRRLSKPDCTVLSAMLGQFASHGSARISALMAGSSKSRRKRGQLKFQGRRKAALPLGGGPPLAAAKDSRAKRASSMKKTASTPPCQLRTSLSPETSKGNIAPAGRKMPGPIPFSGQNGKATTGLAKVSRKETSRRPPPASTAVRLCPSPSNHSICQRGLPSMASHACGSSGSTTTYLDSSTRNMPSQETKKKPAHIRAAEKSAFISFIWRKSAFCFRAVRKCALFRPNSEMPILRKSCQRLRKAFAFSPVSHSPIAKQA